MNDEELWEIENPQNPWLIKKEEEQKDVQREEKLTKEKESPTFFKGGEKVEKRKIIKEIEKGKGGWQDSDSKEMLEIFEEHTKGRTHLNKDDINRIINSLERGIAYKNESEKKIIKKITSKLKELI
ncbi:MAG TPA: hypothetical protein PLF97_00195 [Candidatus Pacearchaeota archaeon]|jgi:hypothetical protein|nr:hypothetical protein [Candidatus Pacearchaeota archaeon]